VRMRRRQLASREDKAAAAAASRDLRIFYTAAA
jgi:hypothetical protein